MPDIMLRLAPRTEPPRAADAWYVPTGAAGEWLAELAAWRTDHASVAIVALGRDGQDLAAAGALLIPKTGPVVASPRCVAFARIAPAFYIPADADLVPPLTPAELAAIVPGDYIHVWRPGAGLTAAEKSGVLHAEDLLRVAPPGSRRWDFAVPGVAHVQRLIALEPIVSLDLQAIIEGGRDDIGSDDTSLDQLPNSPDEAKSGLMSAGAQAAILAAGGAAAVVGGALKGLAKMLPGGGAGAGQGAGGQTGKPTKPAAAGASAGAGNGKLSKLLADKLAAMSRALHASRHKELTRLLHMLDKDPDRGLRFAIPFGGGAHRGVAAGGGRLTERLVNFSLRGLGGGGPVDYWSAPPDYQAQLITKYRELANREIRLGRHRRAAYIFAELLGDLESAAAALRDGRHFREAAILYRDRLKRPLEAAKCFEHGGLWVEAIAEYEQLAMHEEIGDLYTRLEDEEQAAAAYRLAAERCRNGDDYLEAARIEEHKLAAPDRAIVDLETGWLNSRQATRCMQVLFELFGRRALHAEAASRAKELVVDAASSTRYASIANLLADFAGSYPDADVRAVSGESALQVIGGRLRAADSAEAETLCHTLARLAPSDRLLDRDARRYTSRTRKASMPPTPALPAPVKQPRLRVVGTWSFGLPGAWRTADANASTLFVAGIHDKRIVLARSTLGGYAPRHVAPWPGVPVAEDATLLLVADRNRNDRLTVQAIWQKPLPKVTAFAADDGLPEQVVAGTLDGATVIVGAAADASGTTWVADGVRPRLAAFDPEGRLTATHPWPGPSEGTQPAVFPLPMVARNDRLYLGFGEKLVTLGPGAEMSEQLVPGMIHALAASPPYTLNRIAISHEHGAELLWDGSGLHYTRPFAEKLPAPVVGFNRGGLVIAAAGRQFEVYDTKNGKLVRIAEGQLKAGRAIAVFAVPLADRFGLVDDTGTATVYEVGKYLF